MKKPTTIVIVTHNMQQASRGQRFSQAFMGRRRIELDGWSSSAEVRISPSVRKTYRRLHHGQVRVKCVPEAPIDGTSVRTSFIERWSACRTKCWCSAAWSR